MDQNFYANRRIKIGDVYQLLCNSNKDDWVLSTGRDVFYLNGLEEIHFEDDLIILYFPHFNMILKNLKGAWCRLLGIYTEEAIPE